MGVRRIVPNLQAAEPSTSRDFYEGVLGLEMVMDMGWIATFAEPDHPATQVSVISADATGPVVPAVSIEVDDVDAAFRAACDRGYEIVHPLTDEEWGVRRFFVREPSGAVVNVLSHR